MKRAALFLAVAALVVAPAMVLAAENFTADLSAEDEVPAPTVPADYAGSGSASVTISDDEMSIDFEVTFEGLTGEGTATMAHIHFAPPGEAGPVMIWLTEHGVTDGSYESPISGTATEEHFTPVDGGPQTWEEALQAIRDGDTYVNIHTEANPPGEIRGQLRGLPDTAVGSADTSATVGPSVFALALALFGAVALAISLRRNWLRVRS